MQVYQEKQTIKVWYDTNNPANAVLDNRIDEEKFKDQLLWNFILLIMGYVFLRFSKPKSSYLPVMNTEPLDWSLSPDLLATYPSNIILSDAKFSLGCLWFLTIVFIIGAMITNGNSFFIIVGGIVLLFTLHKYLEWRRFGETPLVMSTPGKIGGEVKGDIFVSMKYDEQAVFSILLKCTHRYETSDAQGKKTANYDMVWQEQAQVKAIFWGKRDIKLPFSFTIADNLPETTPILNRDEYYFWEITVHGTMKGVDLDRSYRIPVIKQDHTKSNRSND